MKQMKHMKWTALFLALLLALSCFLTACGDTAGSPAAEPEDAQTQQAPETQKDKDTAQADAADDAQDAEPVDGASDDDADGSGDTAQQPASTDTVKPVQTEPAGNTQQPAQNPSGNTQQPAAQEPQAQTCTISIDCSTILDNMDKLERGKEGLIPADGILLAKTEVQYEDGDTVFTLLKRELQSRKMHYDFEGSGSSAYLAGLCNIYEFDCGKLSGWEFAVNGSFPSVGVGVYKLSPGDSVALIYTCDLGDDIGNHYDG